MYVECGESTSSAFKRFTQIAKNARYVSGGDFAPVRILLTLKSPTTVNFQQRENEVKFHLSSGLCHL